MYFFIYVEDAEFLLEKKRKEEEKKERIKRAEEEFERKRLLKIKAMEERNSKS